MQEAILTYLDEAEVLELTQAMVRVNTSNPPGGEFALAEGLRTWAREAGLEGESFPLGNGRGNLLLRLRGVGDRPALAFAGHLDTVPVGEEPWRFGPHSGTIDDGRLYGRGASDMKGGIAAALAAASAIARSRTPLLGDLFIAATADEEVGCLGATDLVKRRALEEVGALVIPEPTDLQVWIAEKGALWLQIKTLGKAAHGSAPHQGLNAILPLARLTCLLQNFKLPHTPHSILGGPTLSVNTIAGGTKVNVVPAAATLEIDIRLVPGQDPEEVHRMVEDLVQQAVTETAPGVQWVMETLALRPPVETAADAGLIQVVRECVEAVTGMAPQIGGASYFTDAAILVPALQIPVVICGPGDPAQAHQANESVEVRKLLEAARAFTLIALRMLT